MPATISLPPPPVYFIKSISEQGYTLSTAISDLIDNSIAAGSSRVEVLLDSSMSSLRLFIADNGAGMNDKELTHNMRFPSADLDESRRNNDLGRFGLGLKTASFSQCRKFTVLSRIDNSEFEGRTWDVDFLKNTGEWTLIVDTPEVINGLVDDYTNTSLNFHGTDTNFKVKTLVVWDNLYKLKKLKKRDEINDELDELRSHLSLVFHRYLSSGKLQIRLNNSLIEGFEPFPDNIGGVQMVAEQYWQTDNSYVKFQGIILPKRAAAEVKEADSPWVPPGRTLEELQGLFVYRNDRIINYGGWLRTIPKSVYLQFARIRIDISNATDAEFQLNVAKSSLKIPFGLKRVMAEMVRKVAVQAAKEYRERVASGIITMADKRPGLSLIVKQGTGNGFKLKINEQFELIQKLRQQLTEGQNDLLFAIITLIEKKLNDFWQGETGETEITESVDPKILEKIEKIKQYYEDAGYSAEETREFLQNNFGREPYLKNFITNLKFN